MKNKEQEIKKGNKKQDKAKKTERGKRKERRETEKGTPKLRHEIKSPTRWPGCPALTQATYVSELVIWSSMLIPGVQGTC